MSQHYDQEFKKQIVRLHLEEGRTIISLYKEYTVSKAAISKWVKQFRDEGPTLLINSKEQMFTEN